MYIYLLKSQLKNTYQNVCPHFVIWASDIISKHIGLKQNELIIIKSYKEKNSYWFRVHSRKEKIQGVNFIKKKFKKIESLLIKLMW